MQLHQRISALEEQIAHRRGRQAHEERRAGRHVQTFSTEAIMVRNVIVSLALLGCLQAGTLAQPRPGTAAVKPCSLLTPALAQKVSAATKHPLGAAAPTEVSLGANGVACEWGDLMLSVDPYTPARLEDIRKTAGKQWELVPGVGDAAYFHNVRDAMAELLVRVGSRTFVVVITIPVGSTAAAIKPTFVTVANAIATQLR